LQYLCAAGVGKIGIVDFDVVEETNLQRQILFNDSDIGKPKAETVKEKLQKQNPFVEIEVFNTKLSTENALEIISDYEIIIDGTDNFATRYLVNDACFLLKKILISGSIFKFEGQVSVFDFTKENSPTYRCLFPSPPSAAHALSCEEIGVVGVLPGIFGTLMANETIKTIVGIGKTLSGKVLMLNVLNMNFQTVAFERNAESVKTIPQTATAFKKMDYEFFCGNKTENIPIAEISTIELAHLITSKELIQIVDVREKGELPEITDWKSLKIPLSEIETRTAEISKDKKVILICQVGMRSQRAVELLQRKFAFKNLHNLKGGVTEWIKTISKKQEV
ncbi:MAG: ThiF family adenylyltransferase, partial [Aequorivita sp.]|nr:ThiF family adenylyltransferase [Aequorivita sp.]